MQTIIAIVGLLLLVAGSCIGCLGLIIDRKRDFGGAWRLLIAVGAVLVAAGGLLLALAHHL